MAFSWLRHIVFGAAATALCVDATDGFLGRPSLEALAQQADPALLQRLVAEVEDALGDALRISSKHHLAQIEEMLRPTFWALPKNSFSKLDHAAVRYALHRHFVQRHGWVIRGFQQEVADGAWNSSSAVQLLQGRVPGLVQELFEKRIGEQGAGLHDLAVLAVLFEHLIHEDIRSRLRDVYDVSKVAMDAVVDGDRAQYLVNLYMMFFIQGYTDLTTFAPDEIELLVERYSTIYPVWPRALEMLQEVREGFRPGATTFGFEDLAKVIEDASHRLYETVHHEQCQHTKDMLMEMEDGESGRVRLLDFYRAAIYENKYQFTETIDFLRQMGTLDESDSKTPKVIIPNYVSGPSNCIARTSYYAVCCPDACESRFDHLEHVLKRPEASPDEILAWMADGEPEAIPSALVGRLQAIADHHGGQVPLHGRLFAQWMHFAHPQSCVYPHVSGVAYSKTLEEWEDETGSQAGATVQEIMDWEQVLSKQSEQGSAARSTQKGAPWWETGSDMWTMDEELVVVRPGAVVRAKKEMGSAMMLAKGGLFVATFAAALVYVSRAGGAVAASDGKASAKKHWV
eukprot:TRINITY_DN18972_c1_g1_i1.p1 TRINITY_DN18972_c1_g1~~TRINITY_DN18972_c1_g1_i1.p1  ORF type:complete len:591 (-),score=109.45 TRINITY_DN18972_c1_g1_i1:29-1738(-)